MRDEFLWVEKYRPKTIEDCILPENIKKTFLDFLDKGEVPNLLLAGPAGCGKTTVAKALCNQLGVDVYVINGSDEGRFLDTVRNNAKTSPQQFPSHLIVDIKSSSLTRQTTQPQMSSSYLGHLSRNFQTTAGSSSPVTTKTKSLNPSILDAQLSNLELQDNKSQQSLLLSSNDLTLSWTKNGAKLIRRSL